MRLNRLANGILGPYGRQTCFHPFPADWLAAIVLSLSVADETAPPGVSTDGVDWVVCRGC